MAIRDNKSDQKVTLALDANISSNTTTVGTGLDTADYDFGVMFALAATAWTDGTYTLVLEDSDDDGSTDAYAAVSSDMLIGALASVGAADVNGVALSSTGVHSAKRWVRVSIVSTVVTTGADIVVMAVLKGEYNPQ